MCIVSLIKASLCVLLHPAKTHPIPKALPATVCFTEDFVGRGGENYIAHHPANPLKRLTSLCSLTSQFLLHSLSKATTSSSSPLVRTT